jgi:hypothetical protein
MSYAKRMDELKSKGYQFTVDAKYNFKNEKRFDVVMPNGTVLSEQFDDFVQAIRFCEGIEKGK